MNPAAILESIADAVVFADTAGIIRTWNPGAEALFGFPASVAIGQSLDLIIPEHLRRAHWEAYDRALAAGATRHGRQARITRALCASGERLYVDMTFAVVRDAAGAVIGSAAVARDATRRFQEERELKQRLAAAGTPPAGSSPD